MKTPIQNLGTCVILASLALGLSACVVEPVPEAGPVYGAGPYGYPVYPPYYGYGYGYYGPEVNLGFYGGGHDGHSWHHWR